jgi:hypothetical protein
MGSKKAGVISIIALILGASGLGYAFFLGVTMQSSIDTKSGVQKSWFISVSNQKTTGSAGNVKMENMSLTVQVNAGESLYGFFIGSVRIHSSTVYGLIAFYIDNIKIRELIFDYFDFERMSMQILVGNLTQGTHIIEIWWSVITINPSPLVYCYAPSLLVQTLIE